MTLIASINPNGSPMLIGDLLVSKDKFEIPNIDLPSLGELNNSEHLILSNSTKNITPVQTVQKVNILSQNLIVAWAGSYLRAKLILKALRDETANRELSYDLVKNILSDNEDLIGNEVAIIGLLMMPCGTVQAFHKNGEMFDIPGYSDFIYAGTGGSQYFDTLMNISSDRDEDATTLRYPDALYNPAATIWKLLALELITGVPVYNAYGGGFELAYFDDGGAKKLDDIVHYCWKFDINDLAKPPELWNGITKYDYQNDNLIIRRIRAINQSKIGETYPVSEMRYIVPPLVLKHGFDKCDMDDVDYAAKWTCNHFYLRTGCDQYFMRSSIFYSSARKSPILANVEMGRLFLQQDMDYLEARRSEFLQAFNSSY